MTQVLEVT